MVGTGQEWCRDRALEQWDVLHGSGYVSRSSYPDFAFRYDPDCHTYLYMECSCYSNLLLFVGE